MTWAEKAHVDARSEFGISGKLGDTTLSGPQAINKYVSALFRHRFNRSGSHRRHSTVISRFLLSLSTWARSIARYRTLSPGVSACCAKRPLPTPPLAVPRSSAPRTGSPSTTPPYLRYSSFAALSFRPLNLEQISALLQDYDDAVKRAETFETALLEGAAAVSSNYADLVALTARQAMSGTELTIGQNNDGTLNTSDVKMFMKNVGKDKWVLSVSVLILC